MISCNLFCSDNCSGKETEKWQPPLVCDNIACMLVVLPNFLTTVSIDQGCAGDCNGNGECTVGDGHEWRCECHEGFEGDDCEYETEADCSDDVDNDGGAIILAIESF